MCNDMKQLTAALMEFTPQYNSHCTNRTPGGYNACIETHEPHNLLFSGSTVIVTNISSYVKTPKNENDFKYVLIHQSDLLLYVSAL